MKTVKLNYSNFWNSVDPLDAEYFYRMFPALRDEYDLRLDPYPDVVFYGVYGYVDPDKYKGALNVLISCEGGGDHLAEGGKIGPSEYDQQFYSFGLTASIDNDFMNHVYLPPPYINVNLYNGGVKAALVERKPPTDKIHICNFIYSNSNSRDRIEFKNLFSKWKKVMCPGPVDTNTDPIRFTGYNGESYLIKQGYQAMCKFSIAFENCYYPGYTTEKLSDPLIARSVPIYCGNPKVDQIFNTECFVTVKPGEWSEGLEAVRKVYGNTDLYNAMLHAPVFKNNEIPSSFKDETYLKFFKRIFG